MTEKPDYPNLRDSTPFRWRVASMFAPPMWAEFVLPFVERYFQGLTTGTRGAHIEDWVYQAVADGASYVFTHVAEIMNDPETVTKVRALIHAARQVEQMLQQGATRARIGERVTPAGQERFWDHWPE